MTENTNRGVMRWTAYSSSTGSNKLLKSSGAGTAADPIVPIVQLAANPTIDIGEVQLLGDDGAAVLGSAGDAAWSGSGSGKIVGILKALWAAVTGATPAGTNTIGIVNANGATVEVVPTVTAGSYTAGYVMGGIITFSNVLAPTTFAGLLESITVKFKGSVQTTEFDLALFSASPAGTFADHGAPAIATADSALLIGVYPLTANQSSLGTHTVYNLDAIAKQIVGASQTIYGVLTTKAVPVNPASVSDLSVRVGVAW